MAEIFFTFFPADNNGFLHKEDAKWLIILNTAPLFITTLCAWLENGNKPWSVGTLLILYSVPNNLCSCACIVLAISTCVMVLSQDAQAHMRIASLSLIPCATFYKGSTKGQRRVHSDTLHSTLYFLKRSWVELVYFTPLKVVMRRVECIYLVWSVTHPAPFQLFAFSISVFLC